MTLSSFCAKRFAPRFLHALTVIIAAYLLVQSMNASPAGALCIPVSASVFCPSEVIVPDSCCNPSIHPRKQVCFTGRPEPRKTSFPSLCAGLEKNPGSTALEMVSSLNGEEIIETSLHIAIPRTEIENCALTMILPSLRENDTERTEGSILFQDEYLGCSVEGLPQEFALIREPGQGQVIFRFEKTGNPDQGSETESGEAGGTEHAESLPIDPLTAEDEVPMLLTLRITVGVNRDWLSFRNTHPEEESAAVHVLKAALSVREDTYTAENEVRIPASFAKGIRNVRSGLYGKAVFTDTGFERKRPETITFHLYYRDETNALIPMGKEYDRTVEITGEEQYFSWENLPQGSYVIKEDIPEGYLTHEFTEETKDGNLFVYEHTYENKASLHLIKNWTDSNNVPVHQEGTVSFLMETWEIPAEPGSLPVLKGSETIVIPSNHGIFAWDSEDLPLASETADYFYRFKEIEDPDREETYEVTYSLNGRDYSPMEWESSTKSLISHGTVIVTNRKKPEEWILPSTGGTGRHTGYAVLWIALVLLRQRFKEGKGK